MEENTNRFVKLPHNMCKNERIGIAEIVVYLKTKSYRNSKTKICCPSYETIAQDCECGRNKVMSCIETLIQEGYIEKRKVEGRRSNFYYFPGEDDEQSEINFEMIPFRLLDHEKLSARERGFLAILQQHFIVDEEKRTGAVSISELEICNLMKISPTTLWRIDRDLVEKEMLEKFKSNIRDETSRLWNNTRLTFLDKTYQSDMLLAQDLQNTKEVVAQTFTILANTMQNIDRRLSNMEERERERNQKMLQEKNEYPM